MAASSTSFSKERPGKGRAPGVPNKKNRAVADAYEKILTDPEYRTALRRRLIRGTAGPMEVTMHHYVYGKPTETTEVTGKDGGRILLGWMTDDDDDD